MFVTLTQLQKGEASVLQTVIDNTCGKLNVALRGFHYEVGYCNVSSSSGILWRPGMDRDSPNDKPLKIQVPAGLYTIERLSHFLMEEIPGLTLEMNKATGLINLNIPESSGMIKLTGDLRRILGIEERGWIDEEYGETNRQNLLPTSGFIFISTNSQQPLILLMVPPRPYWR